MLNKVIFVAANTGDSIALCNFPTFVFLLFSYFERATVRTSFFQAIQFCAKPIYLLLAKNK